jgi:hypothetical protein
MATTSGMGVGEGDDVDDLATLSKLDNQVIRTSLPPSTSAPSSLIVKGSEKACRNEFLRLFSVTFMWCGVVLRTHTAHGS